MGIGCDIAHEKGYDEGFKDGIMRDRYKGRVVSNKKGGDVDKKGVDMICLTPKCNNPLKKGLEFAYCEKCIIRISKGKINYTSFISCLLVGVYVSVANLGGVIW